MYLNLKSIYYRVVAEKVLPALSTIIADMSAPPVAKMATQIATCVYPLIYRSM